MALPVYSLQMSDPFAVENGGGLSRCPSIAGGTAVDAISQNGLVDDTELLSAWAAKVGMLLPVSGIQVVHGWAGMEIGYEVRRDDDTGYLVVKTDRGNVSTRGRFDSLADADAYLLMCLGSIWRADHWLGDIFPAGAGDGLTPKHDAAGWSVEVAGRRAVFAHESDADRYTHIAGKSLGDIAALMQA